MEPNFEVLYILVKMSLNSHMRLVTLLDTVVVNQRPLQFAGDCSRIEAGLGGERAM